MKKFFVRVEENQTVLSIANKFCIPATYLIKQNGLKKEISAGDVLFVESTDRTLYRVKPHDTAESIALKFGLSPKKILEDNGVLYLFYGLIIMI